MEAKPGSTEQPSSAEQELSQQELAAHVFRLKSEFVNILKSWPEFNGAVVELFLTKDAFHPENTVAFTRGEGYTIPKNTQAVLEKAEFFS